MLNAATHGRVTRRAMLGWTLGSALGLACLPATAAAEGGAETGQDPATALLPVAGDAVWAITIGDASLRGQPDIADNRFGFARPGTPLKILGYTGDWAYVFNPHTQGTAYVYSNLLTPGDAPSRYVSLPAPAPLEELRDTVVVTQDSVLATYPSPAPEAVFMPLPASSVEPVIGSVRGDDGAVWYQTSDFYYVPSNGVFLPSQSDAYTGRWLLAWLLPTTTVVAYEGQTPVRTMFALRGIPRFPTPTGVSACS